MPASKVAVVVESFNETEHSSVERLAKALGMAERATREYGNAKVVLADSGRSADVSDLLAERFPGVERITSDVYDYDAAKRMAASGAGAEVVVFLDGDCEPVGDDWLPSLIRPIVSGKAVGAAGFTMYEGGWLRRVLSVMDFGFLIPRRERPVACYASNNSAFRADALACTPTVEGEMRCRCFSHAQEFARRGTPVYLAPDALAYHEAVPVVRERIVRGWQLVGAARVDPHLREARWLRFGVLAAPLYWAQNVALDTVRAINGGRDFGLGPFSRAAAVPVMASLRTIDLVGIVIALRGRPLPRY